MGSSRGCSSGEWQGPWGAVGTMESGMVWQELQTAVEATPGAMGSSGGRGSGGESGRGHGGQHGEWRELQWAVEATAGATAAARGAAGTMGSGRGHGSSGRNGGDQRQWRGPQGIAWEVAGAAKSGGGGGSGGEAFGREREMVTAGEYEACASGAARAQSLGKGVCLAASLEALMQSTRATHNGASSPAPSQSVSPIPPTIARCHHAHTPLPPTHNIQ